MEYGGRIYKSGRQVYGAAKSHVLTDLRISQFELRVMGHSTTDKVICTSGLLKIKTSAEVDLWPVVLKAVG